mgnify:CR=1 FL=1
MYESLTLDSVVDGVRPSFAPGIFKIKLISSSRGTVPHAFCGFLYTACFYAISVHEVAEWPAR